MDGQSAGKSSAKARLTAGFRGKSPSDAVSWLAESLTSVSVAAILAIMVVTVVDVVGRKFLSRPLEGSLGGVQLLMVVAVFFGLGYTTITNGHVIVDLLLVKFSKRARNVCVSVGMWLCVGFSALLAWRAGVLSVAYSAENAYDKTTGLPLSPFVMVVCFGAAVMTAAFVVLLYRKVDGDDAEARRVRKLAALGILAPAILALIAVFAAYIPEAPPIYAAVGGFLFMLLLMFTGVPVAFAFAIAGVVGIAYTRGIAPALNIVAETSYRTVSSYVFSVLLMFMLMGYLAFQAGFGKDLYDLAWKWVGRLRGGLAQATIVASALFGAIVGDTTAGVATFGTIALPEMRAKKYDLGLSSASIAVGAVLCELIPPSLTFILWAVLTETNVGDLFLAGILPGLLLMVLLCAYVWVRCKLNPELGPKGPATDLREKLRGLKLSAPVLLIFAVVMGGLYGGIFTPTEAGAIGAFCVLLAGLLWRRLKARQIYDACKETVKVVGMCFFVLIGAQIFGSFLATTKLPSELAEFLTAAPVDPMIILVGMLLLWFALGFIMAALGILLLFTPLFLPTLRAFGFDLIWCGVMFCFAIHLGTITPPVAINCFVLKAVAPDIPIGTIFRGVLPMVLICLVALALYVAFPWLSTFLPELLS